MDQEGLEKIAMLQKEHAEQFDVMALRIEQEQGEVRHRHCVEADERHAQNVAVLQAEIDRLRAEIVGLDKERDENRASVKRLKELVDVSESRAAQAEAQMAAMSDHPDVKKANRVRLEEVKAEIERQLAEAS